MRKLLESTIDLLPDDCRLVFVLRAVEELSVKEVADILQIPAATVRSRFLRARSLLRASLAKEADLACQDAFGCAGERCDRIVKTVLTRITMEMGKMRFRTFICQVCGLEYDEAASDPATGIAPGTRWEDMPEDWVCPECGAAISSQQRSRSPQSCF